MGDVLSFEDLSITFGEVEAARQVSFTVRKGEVVAVVGESGSGKSVTAMSALGLLPRKAEVTGTIRLEDREIRTLPGKQLRALRGNEIAMVFQEPMTALSPVHTIGWQVAEAIKLHQDLPDVHKKVVELLSTVGLDRPEERARQYPHELSGGMRQRVMIAMAISCDPKVIIADEPTTALDVTVQAEILDLLRELKNRLGTAIVLITHSMGVVADLADRVVVMYRGDIVEQGSVDDVLLRPEHEYTRRLLKAVPRLGTGTRQAEASQEPVLRVDGLTVLFAGHKAVDDVSFEIGQGEVLGLVGESGSGKTTVGRCAVGLQKPVKGTIALFGQDIANLSAKKMRPLRARIGMVFQDPASSLDPRMTVAECVAEPLILHRAPKRNERVAELLDAVELGEQLKDRYPHELSGGQRQRVSIARALALDPDLLIADEPTSALDVSVQASILELFLDLQRRLKFSCLFISHDLAVVDMLANRVAVMYRGKIVEQGSRADVFGAPQQDYTRRLLAAAPVPDPVEQRERRVSRG
ncbi:peptide/nickel transport system ATP-binding protein [Kibdelosporangium banguiense]|uniref:Peptide/nickel transport system ATP-binding protein n=1 Tax=Kibdelosporangium banguiense TaxID=1365924 RepID=A0ABS4TAB1_9PSEU|nr:ABC transporter ATP-binding protein [Kibdelosporangium banguiense]MBP2321361.1 peptide/nickel transport system ATP-binding protein [Kibdelosporangium banguiense]